MAIEAIRHEISIMGFNDHEFSALDGIQAKLESEEISPEEAIAQANQIRDSKTDYH